MDILKKLRLRSWISALSIAVAIYITGLITSLEFNPLNWIVFDAVYIRLMVTIFVLMLIGNWIKAEQRKRIYKHKRFAIFKAKRLHRVDGLEYDVLHIEGTYYVINSEAAKKLKTEGSQPVFTAK